MRRRRIETFLLAGYAFAVTCALFISLLHKTVSPQQPDEEVADNYDYTSDVLIPVFSDSQQDNPFEDAFTEIQNIPLLSDNQLLIDKFVVTHDGVAEVVMPGEPKPKHREQYGSLDGIYRKERHVVMVESGDTFIKILNRMGMDTKGATEAYNALRKVYDARRLQVGQYFLLVATYNLQSHTMEKIDSLSVEPERGTRYILRTNEYDRFETQVEQEKFARDIKVVKGKVTGAVGVSMANAGVPRKFHGEIVNAFSHIINLNRQAKKGDTFEVKYEVSKAANGDVVKVGNLLYASFTSGKNTYKQYRFKNAFYDAKGQAKKTGLDKKPLAARNARVSSLFGYRRHPILKTVKFHSGVDYAAPRGTAIFASGNGVVEMARYVGGYGNFVKIRHNSTYETAYGHMQGFARGIRPGVRVRKGQVIGYVGSTGRSTGPHLHFEILRHGQRINPLKAQVATGNDLTGGQLNEFKRTMRNIDATYEKIKKQEVKSAPALTQPAVTAQADSVSSTTPEQKKADDKSQTVGNTNDENTKPAPMPTTEKAEENSSHAETAEKEDNQPNEKTVVAESPESNDADKVVNYKGKTVYPTRISAVKARQSYLSASLTNKHKAVMPGKKRPSYAQRRAVRR